MSNFNVAEALSGSAGASFSYRPDLHRNYRPGDINEVRCQKRRLIGRLKRSDTHHLTASPVRGTTRMMGAGRKADPHHASVVS